MHVNQNMENTFFLFMIKKERRGEFIITLSSCKIFGGKSSSCFTCLYQPILFKLLFKKKYVLTYKKKLKTLVSVQLILTS